jgi:hypothetical protein
VHRDSAPVAGFLLAEEAEMLSELLSSAGIDSWTEGAIASVLGPVLRAGGGARLLVHQADAERAREVIARSGLFRSEGDGERPGDEQAAPAGDAPGEERGRKTFVLYPLVVLALVTAGTVLALLLVVR